MQADPRGVAEEANRLYWQSETSVAEIASQLDLSRRALYNAIVPLPTETSCTRCGAPLTYANRSARDAREARCTVCPELDAEALAASEAAPAGNPGAAADEAPAPTFVHHADDERTALPYAAADAGAGAVPGNAGRGDADDAAGLEAALDGGAYEGVELRRRAIRLTTAALVGAAVGAAAAFAFSRDA